LALLAVMQAGSRRYGCVSGDLLALGAFGKLAVDRPQLSLDRRVCGGMRGNQAEGGP
jgi:hypothetical protein